MAERDWRTPFQSEDPSPTIPTYRQKEEKGKKSKRLVWIEQLRPIKKHWPCSWNPPDPHHRIWGQQDSSRYLAKGIKVLLDCKVLQPQEPCSPAGLLFPSRCPSGTILLKPYSMVWVWRVSRAGPMLLYWPKLLYPYYSLLLFFPFSFFCL